MSEEKKEEHPVLAMVASVLGESGGAVKDCWCSNNTTYAEYNNGSNAVSFRIGLNNNDWKDKLDNWSSELKAFAEGCSSFRVFAGELACDTEEHYLLINVRVWKAGYDNTSETEIGNTGTGAVSTIASKSC